MKKYLLLNLFIFFLNFAFAQKTIIDTKGPITNTINYTTPGIVYFYNPSEYNNLLSSTFNIENKKTLNRELYEKVDLNILSKNQKLGELNFIDTLFYPENITFEDANDIISQSLSNTYLTDFNVNDYGLYYFDVRFNISYFYTQVFNYKIELKKDKLFLSCNQNLNFYTYEHQSYDNSENENDFYNSYKIGISPNDSNQRFRKEKAYKQLVNLAIYNNAKIQTFNYFKGYFDAISAQKKYFK
jgi:hypothetical protein